MDLIPRGSWRWTLILEGYEGGFKYLDTGGGGLKPWRSVKVALNTWRLVEED